MLTRDARAEDQHRYALSIHPSEELPVSRPEFQVSGRDGRRELGLGHARLDHGLRAVQRRRRSLPAELPLCAYCTPFHVIPRIIQ